MQTQLLTRKWKRVDTPLRRRRLQMRITQEELGKRCGVTVGTIARFERGERIPRGEMLECLIKHTGLETDALVRPSWYLNHHPAFLHEFAAIPKPKRGRPPRP